MMTKSEEAKARRELQHALDALGDGSGRDVWGPGIVGQKLWNRFIYESPEDCVNQATQAASHAFDVSAQLAVKLGMSDPKRMYACMRKVAPVLLEVLLERE